VDLTHENFAFLELVHDFSIAPIWRQNEGSIALNKRILVSIQKIISLIREIRSRKRAITNQLGIFLCDFRFLFL